MSRQARPQGFTLMELVVVMVLLSLMTAFAVPKIRTSLFSDQLKSTARRVIGLVNATGQEARSEHRPYLLIFDSTSREFRVRTEKSVTGKQAEKETPVIRPVSVPEGVRVLDFTSVHGGTKNSGELFLRFSKKGYVDKTLIHFSDGSGRELTLSLSPFLGVSRLYDSYRTLEQDDLQW
jgi:general secretion pathway protein H